MLDCQEYGTIPYIIATTFFSSSLHGPVPSPLPWRLLAPWEGMGSGSVGRILRRPAQFPNDVATALYILQEIQIVIEFLKLPRDLDTIFLAICSSATEILPSSSFF